jgi:molybdopterin synthase sulfur carrier subunit
MKIKYFAWLKDITKNESELYTNSNITNINELKKYIVKKYPDLKKHLDQDVLRIAVNNEYTVENISLNVNDEIAIFPPVSGG